MTVCAPAGGCDACVNDAIGAGGACERDFVACAARVGCQSINLCVADCGSPASANCVDACLAAEPESAALYQTVTDCIDSTCANACN